jgi:WD40 repeat protein
LPLAPRVTQTQRVLPEQPWPIQTLAFAPNGDTLAFGGVDGTVALWDRRLGEVRLTFKAHEQRVKALAFAPDGDALATGGQDRWLQLWDPATGAPRATTFPRQKRDVDAVAFSRDGRLLAAVLGYGKGGKGTEQVVLWDAHEGRELARLPGHRDGAILSLAFAPDGKTLATAGVDGSVRLWDVEARQERAPLLGHVREVFGVAFSPDGALLATAGRDGTVRLWDGRTGELRQVLAGHRGDARAVAFLPGGRLLASAGHDGIVRLWDVRSGREVRNFQGPKRGALLALAVSPDGNLLAAGGAARQVVLWDLSGQQPVD